MISVTSLISLFSKLFTSSLGVKTWRVDVHVLSLNIYLSRQSIFKSSTTSDINNGFSDSQSLLMLLRYVVNPLKKFPNMLLFHELVYNIEIPLVANIENRAVSELHASLKTLWSRF